jgi:hypothetical protein
MTISGAKGKIHANLQDWPGITSQPHRFGGIEYSLGRREIGHVHGDSLVDIPFPKEVRDELVSAGRAEPHHTSYIGRSCRVGSAGWRSPQRQSRLSTP